MLWNKLRININPLLASCVRTFGTRLSEFGNQPGNNKLRVTCNCTGISPWPIKNEQRTRFPPPSVVVQLSQSTHLFDLIDCWHAMQHFYSFCVSHFYWNSTLVQTQTSEINLFPGIQHSQRLLDEKYQKIAPYHQERSRYRDIFFY